MNHNGTEIQHLEIHREIGDLLMDELANRHADDPQVFTEFEEITEEGINRVRKPKWLRVYRTRVNLLQTSPPESKIMSVTLWSLTHVGYPFGMLV